MNGADHCPACTGGPVPTREFAPGLQAYFATAGRPENQPFVQLLFKNGTQQPDGIETDLGTSIGKLRQNR